MTFSLTGWHTHPYVNHDVWLGIHVGHSPHTHAHAGLDPRQGAWHPAQAGTHAHTHEDPRVEGKASY